MLDGEMADAPTIVNDLELAPLTRVDVEEALARSSPFEVRGGWAPRDYAIRRSQWQPDLHVSVFDMSKDRWILDRARLDAFLENERDDPALAWAVRRVDDRELLALALLAYGPPPTAEEMPGRAGPFMEEPFASTRMIELVTCVPPGGRGYALQTVVNPVPRPDVVIRFADLAAQADRAIERGAPVLDVARALLEFLEHQVEPEEAARRMIQTLRLPIQAGSKFVTLDRLRETPEEWHQLMETSVRMFRRSDAE
jgi:hypothetical protein